jgi:uncharacterized protein (DUF4415 family)
MSRTSPKRPPPPDFNENPEWTEDDFARAVNSPGGIKITDIAPEMLEKVRLKSRGPQKTPTKVAVSLRLSADVLTHFKSTGPGWQTRIDEALRKVAKLKAG